MHSNLVHSLSTRQMNKIYQLVSIFNLVTHAAAKLPGDPGPLTGWNTWCTQNECAVDWCTSWEVLSVAQAIKDSGLLALGWNYINLDDCWGLRNESSTHIYPDPERFPQGMPAFINTLHDMGFKVGVYTDMGENACTKPFTGSWPYYQQDANDFASWGVDFVKFDYCGPPQGHEPADLTQEFSDAINNTGREMWFNFHCDEMTWEDSRCGLYGDSYRISPDHIDAWYSTIKVSKYLQTRQSWWGNGYPDPDFVYTGGQGCGSHSLPGERCPGQTDIEYQSEYSVWAIAGGQLLFATDPRNMSAVQKQAFFNTEILDVFRDTSGFDSIQMIGSGSTSNQQDSAGKYLEACSVMLQEQLSQGTDCVLDLNYGCGDESQQLIWVDDGCRGLFECYGVQNIDCESSDGSNITCPCIPEQPQVWVRAINDGKEVAVVFFNAADTLNNITVNFSELPSRNVWDSMTTLSVRDLWLHKDLGSFTSEFTAVDVLPHASFFLKLYEDIY